MTRPIRVLELRSVRGTGGGPEKTILLGAARSDPRQVVVTVCYLRDQRDHVFAIDQKAAMTGVDYLELVEKHSFDISVFPALRRLVRERGIHIVHAHDYKTDLLAYLLGKFEPVVTLSTAHGWTGQSSRERRVYYPLDKRLLARFPQVIAVSSDIRSVLIANGLPADRVTVVLNGIDHRVFVRDAARVPAARAALGYGAADIVVGSVGRLENQKRFDILIESIAALQPGYPALKLLVAGDGSLLNALTAKAKARLTPGSWRFLGHTEDVIGVHHALDLFVQSSDYEGTPNAVLEAMALETPLVATAAGGTAELINDDEDGLIVAVGDRRGLTSAIGRMLQDPAAAQARARSARRRIEERLSFEKRMQTVEAIYERLADGREPAGVRGLAT